MKRCPYCGADYPDDAMVCAIDRMALEDKEEKKQLLAQEQVNDPPPSNLLKALVQSPEQITTARRSDSNQVYPEYQWTARDGWKCVGMMLVFEFVIGIIIYGLDSHSSAFHQWHRSGFGYFMMQFLDLAVMLLTAVYFARTDALITFSKAFGLDRKPSEYVWFGVAAALIIRFFGHSMIIHRWGNGVPSPSGSGFRNTIGASQYFFLASPVLLAPLLEEMVNRGFLYKALRGSYSIGFSIVLILVWTAYTHWFYYSHSKLAACDLTLLTIVQCYLREKSGSLWDCIICHFVFNASAFVVAGSTGP